MGNFLLIPYFIHSCAIPVSDVISPKNTKTLFFNFFLLIDKATPTAIGSDPPTIAEEYILCSGKQREIEFPLIISFSNFFEYLNLNF